VVTVYVSRTQASQLVLDISSTGHVSAVFSEPFSHRTVQLKATRAALLWRCRSSSSTLVAMAGHLGAAVDLQAGTDVPDPSPAAAPRPSDGGAPLSVKRFASNDRRARPARAHRKERARAFPADGAKAGKPHRCRLAVLLAQCRPATWGDH
jgi:hypothetical protein